MTAVTITRSARWRARTTRVLRHAWYVLACLALPLAPVARAVCGGSATSPLSLPAVTYLRGYRAPFGVPTRVAVDSSGNVYVTDTALEQVIVRAANGRVLSRVGNLGRPLSIAVGSNGQIYVGDEADGSVTVFDQNWQPVRQLGQGAGEFGVPNDLAVDAVTGNVYVADRSAQLIKVYGPTGGLLRSFGGPGTGDGQFHAPVSVAVNPASRRVFVVDQLNYRVQVFDVDGNFLSCFGAQGNAPGQFNLPQGVAADGDGRIYVSDALEGRIVVLDDAGGFIGYIGDFGDAAGQLRVPVGMGIDPSRRLFVAAANNARLEMFGLDTFADPETILPAVAHMDPSRVERATPGGVIAAYIEVPGYPVAQIALGSLIANGLAAQAIAPEAGDHDGNGVFDVRVEFDSTALLATLPPSGTGSVTIAGQLGTQQFEATAMVDITTCGAGVICPLGDADPQCNVSVCNAPDGCGVQPKADGTGCEDGNACTVDDACLAGVCSGTTLNCADGNACTDDRCDPVAGCGHVDNTASCDDGNACTLDDACGGGVCSGTARACDDGNACTDDTCDPVRGCVFADNAAACDDGNACTVDDVCGAGSCAGTARGCDDGNGCTDDRCDPTTGCVYAAITASCDDGNRCTIGDTCAERVCTGAPLSCDDGEVCTDDRCDPASGCVHDGNTAPCDDGDSGTVGDVCDGAGACRGHVLTRNYALLCWPPESDEQRWAFVGGNTPITGDICAESIAIGSSSLIDGDVVAWRSSGPAVAFLDTSQVTGDVVTGGGAVLGLLGVTVGGRVDVSGSGTELAACLAARHKANAWREQVAALAPSAGLAVGAARIRSGSLRRIPPSGSLGAGRIVVEVQKLHLAPASELTLVGTASTEALIVRVHGRMELGRDARIVLEGLSPERVIFVVDGSAILQPSATVLGSVFATGRVMLGRGSRVSGAIFGNGIILAPGASVDLHPFVEW